MSRKLAEVFNKMYHDTKFTDCTIIVDSIKFECHKIVLSIESEFFRRMFLSNFKEASSREIILQDVTPVIFKIFREFMYTYDSSVLNNYDMQTLISLYECGNMWMAPYIVKKCAEILLERANRQAGADLPIFFELGHKYNNSILINGITDILRSNEYTAFNGNNSIFLLKYDTFQKFISFLVDCDEDDFTTEYLKFNEILKYKRKVTTDLEKIKLDESTVNKSDQNQNLKIDQIHLCP